MHKTVVRGEVDIVQRSIVCRVGVSPITQLEKEAWLGLCDLPEDIARCRCRRKQGTALLARAEGKVSGEEFERRQAALYASLMDSPQPIAPAMRHHLRWAVPALIVIIVVPPVVLYHYFGKPKEMDFRRDQAQHFVGVAGGE